MPFTQEAAEVPGLIIIRPTFNTSGNITAVPSTFNYVRRIKNDADSADIVVLDTKQPAVDLYDNVKTANVAGIGTFTYRQVLQLLKKIGDQERALLP